LVIIIHQLTLFTDYATTEASPGISSTIDMELLRALLDLVDVDEYDEATLSPLSKLKYAQDDDDSSTIDYGTRHRQVTYSQFIQRDNANKNQRAANTDKANLGIAVKKRKLIKGLRKFVAREGEGVIPRPPTYKKKRVTPKKALRLFFPRSTTTYSYGGIG